MALYMGDRKIAGGGSVSAAAWGRITGDIQSQADLAAALREKSDVGHNHDERYALKGEGGNGGLMPAVVGSIVPYMGTDLPEGYLMCDGSEVSKAAYSELYAVVGDRFGTTSDTSKFKLPKIDDARYLQGSDTPGTVVNAGLPNISGEIMFKWSGMYESEGDNNALSSSDSVSECGSGAGNSNRKLTLNASKCNSVYGNSDTVTPFSITVRYLICYKKVIGKVDAMIGMPDYTKGYEIDYNWTAIESGWVFYRAGGNGTFILKVNGIQIFAAYRDAGGDSSHVENFGFPISKGDILEYSRSGNIQDPPKLMFYPCKSVQQSRPADCVSYVVETGRFYSGTGQLAAEGQTNDSWYRLYSDGWCEMGGKKTYLASTGTNTETVTLAKSFLDTSFTLIFGAGSSGHASDDAHIVNEDKNYRTVNTFGIQVTDSNASTKDAWNCWRVEGFVNQ